jgi:GNAT superfamily N-acetyltransferase
LSTSAPGEVVIRPAVEADAGAIHAMIVGLAEYEREPDKVKGTPAQLTASLFGPSPVAETVIAEIDGEVAGFALFYTTFSSWECSAGLWLEDLYVWDRYRKDGVGSALLRHLAGITVARGYPRLEWVALDWNDPALKFYAKHGAELMDAWKQHRLSGDALQVLANTPK